MSSSELQLVFEGNAVEGGLIDAQILGETLSGYGQLFRCANALANGEASEAAVLVESDFKSGSFIVTLQFEQNLIETAKNFITNHEFYSAGGLAALIGFIKNKEVLGESLLDLWKWLRGKSPDNVTQTGNNTEITFGTNKKTVSNVTYHMYGDSAIRAAFGSATEALRREGFDRIVVRQDNVEQVAIGRDEAGYFEPMSFHLDAESTPTEGERDAVLIVSKLAFSEKSKWSFFEQGGTVVAKIEDKDFWQRVHDHTISFGEGDRLRVRLHWKVEEKARKLKQTNRIIKVHQVLDRPKQMRLDGNKDDDVLRRPRRMISLDDE